MEAGGEPATTIAAAVIGRDVVVKYLALQPLPRLLRHSGPFAARAAGQRALQSLIRRRPTTIQHRFQNSEPAKLSRSQLAGMDSAIKPTKLT
jgi:hypothetical protein